MITYLFNQAQVTHEVRFLYFRDSSRFWYRVFTQGFIMKRLAFSNEGLQLPIDGVTLRIINDRSYALNLHQVTRICLLYFCVPESMRTLYLIAITSIQILAMIRRSLVDRVGCMTSELLGFCYLLHQEIYYLFTIKFY